MIHRVARVGQTTQRFVHPLGDRGGVLLDLEVPETQNFPSSLQESLPLRCVASDVSLDLLVPVAIPASWLPLAGMPVPEGAVYEDGELPARKSEIDAAAWRSIVTAVASDAELPKGASQQPLRTRVRSTDARHNPATALRAGWRGAKSV